MIRRMVPSMGARTISLSTCVCFSRYFFCSDLSPFTSACQAAISVWASDEVKARYQDPAQSLAADFRVNFAEAVKEALKGVVRVDIG